MPSVPLLIVICTFVLTFGSCGNVRGLPSGSSLGAGDQDSPLQTFLSALSTVSQSLNDAENTGISSTAANAPCPNQISACTASQRTIGYNSCIAGAFTVSGTVFYTYNTDQACGESLTTIPSAGTSVLRTTSALSFTASNGVTTKVSSESFSNYLGAAVGGGDSIFFTGPQAYTLNVNGITRVRSTVNGSLVFSHSIRSTQPLVISGSRTTNNRNINYGTLVIDNNGARYSSTLQFFSVGYTGTCCHPASGRMNATYSGSFNSVISMTFSSSPCGSAEVTTTTGGNTTTSNVVLPSCE